MGGNGWEALLGCEITADDAWMSEDPEDDLARPTRHTGTVKAVEGFGAETTLHLTLNSGREMQLRPLGSWTISDPQTGQELYSPVVTVTVPKAFVDALRRCLPNRAFVELSRPRLRHQDDEGRRRSFSPEQVQALADAAAQVWWECLQSADDNADEAEYFATAARTVLDQLPVGGMPGIIHP
ncbi:hypothetical protein ABZW18_00200 [Streptomyces sp. NPDC004647]|uniref:hypothetical protein n=1 Tax=Streptomyces sp. NPDC004647 TaxID=3154671 RepID=UPI0033A9E6D5